MGLVSVVSLVLLRKDKEEVRTAMLMSITSTIVDPKAQVTVAAGVIVGVFEIVPIILDRLSRMKRMGSRIGTWK